MKIRIFNPFRSGISAILSVLTISYIAAPSASAATLYWSGDGISQGGPGTWDTTLTRWGTAAGGPYTLVWNNANNDVAELNAATGTITLGANVTVGGINAKTGGSGNTISEGAGPYTITLGVTGTNTISTAASVTAGRIFNVNAVIAGASGANLRLTGPGTSGAGTVTLNRANTFAGGTSFSGHSGGAVNLTLGNQNALQNSTLTLSAPCKTLTFSSTVGANAFTFGGLAAASAGAGRDFALENNAGSPAPIALSVGNNNADTSYAGVLSGAGSLIKIGTGTLTLLGANTYSGATQVDGGILTIGNTAAKASATVTAAAAGSIGLGVGAAPDYYVAADVLALFNTNSLTGFSLDPASGVGVDTTGGDLSLSSGQILTGTRSLTKLGSGNLTLVGNQTYTGATTIADGTLILGNYGTTGKLAPTGTITIAASGNLNVRRADTMTQGVDFSSAPITGGGSFSKGGAGTTVFNAANAYTGTTFVNDGVLRLDTADALPGGIGATGGTSTLAIGAVVGLASGNFSRTHGTNSDQFYWTDDGGFAAYGADRTVNLGAGGIS